VHVRDVRDPQRNFPRAMLFSVLLILLTMILGSLAITFVLPPEKINLVGGVMQAYNNFLGAWHLTFLMPLVIIMILIGSLGLMVNWIISPAKGLLLAANHGFLPNWLKKTNKQGIAHRILLLQAILVTVICGTFSLLPSINAIYWLFTALSTELYLFMYVLLFIAALRIKSKFASLPRPFKIPGGAFGFYFVCILGLFGCVLSLIVGFIPPAESINTGDIGRYRLLFSSGILLMLLPAFLLYLRRKFWVTAH
jgi:amino acid transporter